VCLRDKRNHQGTPRMKKRHLQPNSREGIHYAQHDKIILALLSSCLQYPLTHLPWFPSVTHSQLSMCADTCWNTFGSQNAQTHADTRLAVDTCRHMRTHTPLPYRYSCM
jgi:hypothetical protein